MRPTIRRALVVAVIGLAATGAAATPPNSLEIDITAMRNAHLYVEQFTRLSAIIESEPENTAAKRMLGEAYAKGWGTAADPVRAALLYRDAAAGGDWDAQFMLGQAYEKGEGVTRSAAAAITWYDTAASKSPQAALRYAQIALAKRKGSSFIITHDPIDRLEFASANGIDEATYLLASMMLKGDRLEVNRRKATELLTGLSARLPKAKSALGALKHAESDYSRAKQLFQEAYEGGDSEAAAYLGHYAELGIGEAINRRKAHQLYARAVGVSWATVGKERLDEHFSSFELFGLPMYGLTRRQLKDHLQKNGMSVIGGEDYFDAFDATALMNGRSAILTVAYAPGSPEYIAEINYQFDVSGRINIRKQFDELTVSLTKEYGEPDSESRERGNKTFGWVQGKSVIHLSMLPKKRSLTITYHLNPYFDTLSHYIAARNRREEGVLSDAF